MLKMNPETKKFIKNRRLEDRVYRLIHELKFKVGMPVFYNLLELDNVTSPAIAVRDLLTYYFNNSNHNAFVIATAATGNRQFYLVSTLGKPLGKVDRLEHFLKLESNGFIKVLSMDVSDCLAGAIHDIITKPRYIRVKFGLQSFNDQVTINYSRAVYRSRKDYNFNVNNNRERLINVENKLMNHTERK